MSFIQKIKQQIAERIISEKLKKNPRKKEFHNLNSAKSIGIFFDTLDDKSYPTAKKFSEDLSKKGYQVQTIGWINANELPDFGVAQKIIFYTNKDVKWTGEPIATEVADFIDKPFDLLFILTDSNHKSVQYISKLAKAKCKIGRLSDNNAHLDLLIDQNKNGSLQYLITESLKYLSQIQK